MASAANAPRRSPRSGLIALLAACLIVAGALRATLPTSVFTLEWSHSIEHTRWQETYAVVDGRIAVTRARIEGMGAGMEAGERATFDGSGWSWTPTIAPLAEVALTLSPYTADYQLCAGDRCRSLYAWTGVTPGTTAVVDIRACKRAARP
ncbi:MAG: DUF1850 domain-containing protein [Casimicrobiaceae bacterium]